MSATPAAPQRRHASFGPGLALAAGAALLAMAVVHFRQANVVSGIEIPSVSEFELNRLIDRVTGPQRSAIPVASSVPPENGEDLPPAESELRASVKSSTGTPSFVAFVGSEPKGRDVDALPGLGGRNRLTTFPELSGVIKTGPNATQEDAERKLCRHSDRACLSGLTP
ncbi:MAG: hypothetical protein R3C02_22150 [Planctomycetaceae bacterium]